MADWDNPRSPLDRERDQYGGPHTLIEGLEHDPLVQAYRVQLGVDAKPPGRDRDYDDRNDGTPTEANPRMPECYRDT